MAYNRDKPTQTDRDVTVGSWEKRRDGRPVYPRTKKYPDPPTVAYPRWLNRLPKTSGVYFIFDMDGEIYYVGKSKNMWKRVDWSITTGQFFVAFLEFPPEELSYAESYYIGLLSPKGNWNSVGHLKASDTNGRAT